MTFIKFWGKLCEKKPGLKDPNGSSVTISVESFKKQLSAAYVAGAKHQQGIHELADKLANVGKAADPFGFRNMFNL